MHERNIFVGSRRGRTAPAEPGDLYIVAIGVGNYAQTSLRLSYPAKDAQDFTAVFKAQEGRLFRSVTSRVLCDEEARRRPILEAVDWLRQKTTDKDLAALFLAGHGCNHLETGNYYYLPWDVEPESLISTAVAGYELREQIVHIRCKRLIFMDTCRAGNVFSAGQFLRLRGDFGVDASPFIRELQQAGSNAVIVFASSTGQQPSAESDRWSNGAFTKALVEGLRGKACDGGREAVTVNGLASYVGRRVNELTRGLQTPTTAILHTVADFPLSVGPFTTDQPESASPLPIVPAAWPLEIFHKGPVPLRNRRVLLALIGGLLVGLGLIWVWPWLLRLSSTGHHDIQRSSGTADLGVHVSPTKAPLVTPLQPDAGSARSTAGSAQPATQLPASLGSLARSRPPGAQDKRHQRKSSLPSAPPPAQDIGLRDAQPKADTKIPILPMLSPDEVAAPR